MIHDKQGLRIYNLFPRLIGTIDKWDEHISRITDMKFNWIYVNPLNQSGFSGSLYSIKEFSQFNPLFADPKSKNHFSWVDLRKFIDKCHNSGLNFIYDLVINHCSIDSPLIEEFPENFTEKWAIVNKETSNPVKFHSLDDKPQLHEKGEYSSNDYYVIKKIENPHAIDPADSRKITIWGDLTEINYKQSNNNRLLAYWKNLLKFYIELGVDGFRCDAAYQIPAKIWTSLIEYSRTLNVDAIFLAETLGCTLDQLSSTVQAGFNYIYNSSKYWDYSSPWLLEQYENYRKYAPSIGFPESHDTKRLAAESGMRKDVQIFKYFFSAFFSTGVMIPIGYEFMFQKSLDVVKMEPSDWENTNFEILDEIRKINIFKMKYNCLNEDGKITHYLHENSNILIIKKGSVDNFQHMLLIYNKNWEETQLVKNLNLGEYMELETPIYRIDLVTGKSLNRIKLINVKLNPNEMILFLQEKQP